MRILRILKILYLKFRLPLDLFHSVGFNKSSVKLMMHYFNARLFQAQTDNRHLEETMRWLSHAQDVCKGSGVSAVNDLKTGWAVGYPETSGYIIGTYLVYSKMTKNKDWIERARQLGNWEIDIQTPGGGILSNPKETHTRVFNTGQVILGWCMLYEETRDKRYLDAAVKAGNYLIKLQEDDGAWRIDTYCGARTYHARVDWSLLRLAQLTGNKEFSRTAINNINWVLEQQQENGWFENCGFQDKLPIMHVIVYTLRGLLECHLMNDKDVLKLDLLSRVKLAADHICQTTKEKPVNGIPGMVPTSFDRNWETRDAHSCLTGNAQFACFLYRLAQTTGEQKYKIFADEVLDATKQTQLTESDMMSIRGALAGCYPIYKGYHPNSFPNWAAKFFADSLIMKLGFKDKIVVLA